MKTSPITPADFARSVWAVPPLAMNGSDAVADGPNRALTKHIEAGGVSTILWGGNANLYHATGAAFADLVAKIPDWVANDTWAIPSVGPDAGRLLEQAEVLRGRGYPAALALPFSGPCAPEGIVAALRAFVDRSGTPLIIYLRRARYLSPETVAELLSEGTIVGVKYAVEPEDFATDLDLAALCDAVPPQRIVSGIGELAALEHLPAFSLAGFTAGAVCIAPRRAMAVLKALQNGNLPTATAQADAIRPLEALRVARGPIPVIHAAVTASGIADMGEIAPMFAPPSKALFAEIETAVRPLVETAPA